MPAWAAGSWAADAWAGTAWDETAPTVGQSWFETAWAPGAWGATAWAAGGTPPPSDWDLEVPTIGPALSGTFGASGDFEFLVDDLPFSLEAAGPVALSATIDASGDFSAVVYVPTVTLRILDKAEAGSGLAASSGWDFFWYDSATTMAEAVVTTPTVSLTSQSIGADGAKVLTLTGSSKTSGQSGYLMFSNGVRSFAAVVEVD